MKNNMNEEIVFVKNMIPILRVGIMNFVFVAILFLNYYLFFNSNNNSKIFFIKLFFSFILSFIGIYFYIISISRINKRLNYGFTFVKSITIKEILFSEIDIVKIKYTSFFNSIFIIVKCKNKKYPSVFYVSCEDLKSTLKSVEEFFCLKGEASSDVV